MRISKEHLDTMKLQFSLDYNLAEAEKINEHIWLAPTKKLEGARLINGMDLFFKAAVFLGDAYIMADESTIPGWAEILKDSDADWFFNFGHLRKIDYILGQYDREIVDTHIYFLPDEEFPKREESDCLKWLSQDEIEAFRGNNSFSHALCFSPTQPDVRALAKMDGNRIVAMAGSSTDGKYVEQIGIDVLPEYRGKGISVELVTLLKQRIIKEGICPFYGTNESHSLSRSVGVRSGFLPAFSELFVAEKKHE